MKSITGASHHSYLWIAVVGFLVLALASASLLHAQDDSTIKHPEKSDAVVARFTADDPEDDEIRWSKSGDDEALFAISEEGVLTFDSPPDFEAPGDVGTNNIYEVTVTATDDDDTPLAGSHDVMVEVINVEETATVGIELSSLQPQVSTAITVDYVDGVGNPLVDENGAAHTGIVDPDRDKADPPTGTSIPADDVTWQWSKSSSKGGRFTDIPGEAAKTVSYTPGSLDRGMFLRVTGTYEDGEGEGKTVEATSAYPVRAFPVGNSDPGFPEDFDDQTDGDDPPAADIDDGATEGAAVGDPIEASDPNNDRLTYSLTADTGGTAAHADVFQIDRATGQVSVGLDKTVHPTSDTGETASAAVVIGDRFTFTIIATDPSGRMDTVTMTVTVTAADEAPVFTEAGGEATHTFEEIPVGTDSPDLEVHTFAATDVEGDTVTLSMSGADSSKFTFVPGTGVLSFMTAPDYETPGSADGDNVYEITITAASTGSGQGATQKRTALDVTVTVTDEDDPGTIGLSADEPRLGTALTATAPSDTDGGVSGVTWKWERDSVGTAGTPSSDCTAIAAGGWEEAKGTGAETVSYTPSAGDVGKCLRATATYTDANGPDKSASAISTQAVAAARNLAPVFTDEDMDTDGDQLNEREVPENSAAGTNVGDRVVATDTDDDETDDNDALAFALSGANAGLFDIDSSGQITVAAGAQLDHETNDTYTVTITVRDLEGLNSSIKLTINVTNVNEAPEVSGTSSVEHPEKSDAVVARFTADDPEDDEIRWSKSGDDEALFAISEEGVLTFDSPPDFEAPGDVGTNNIYEVTVTATDDDDTPLAGSHDVMVEVINVEETATVGIELSSLQPQVSTAITVDYVDGVGNPLVDENGAAHTGIVDPDRDKADPPTGTSIPADDVTWQWSKSSSKGGRFTDIPGEAAKTVSYTPGSLDRGMFLRVTGTYEDGEGEGKTVEATSAYPVRAFPVGNSDPGFPEDFDDQTDGDDPPAADIDDGATEGAAVGDPIEASDPNNDRLTYSLTADTGGTAAHADVFQIDRATGQVSVGLDKTVHPTSDTGETASAAVVIGDRFTFTIIATDPSGRMDTVTMTVTVTAADEAPVFTEAGGEATHTFEEIPVGTDSPDLEVHTFAATDVEGDTVTLSMSGADSSKFTFVPGTGVLSFMTAPDYETPGSADGDNVYEITITAASTGSGQGATQKRTALDVTVTVTDEDDPGTIGLSADEPRLGTALTATAPSDTDGGVSGVTWKWERDSVGTAGTPSSDCTAIAAGGWEEAKGTGAETVSYTPSAGDVGKCLRATATYTDANGPDKSASAISTQAVAAARNLAPVFTDEDMDTDGDQLNEREVPENSAAGTNVGDRVVATDTDDDETDDNDALAFALSGANAGLFDIDSSGQITVAAGAQLDHETNDTYTVTITVRDLEGLNSSIKLTINVTNVNEAPEVMRAGSIPNRAPTFPSSTASRNIPENTAADMNIGAPVEADDPDNDTLTYTLEGTDAASFDINAGTGQLLTKAALDRATKSTYQVVVRAEDQGGLYDTVVVTITVTEVDENQAPAFPFPTASREIAEDTAAGENIGSPVEATDGDDDPLTYELSGADMADFDIDRGTGQLKTKSPLDYETKSTYTVTVTARDGNGGHDDVTVTITVTDVDETQPLLTRYDADNDGYIQLDEARVAVGDYFEPPKGVKLSLEDARKVVGLYFEWKNSQS